MVSSRGLLLAVALLLVVGPGIPALPAQGPAPPAEAVTVRSLTQSDQLPPPTALPAPLETRPLNPTLPEEPATGPGSVTYFPPGGGPAVTLTGPPPPGLVYGDDSGQPLVLEPLLSPAPVSPPGWFAAVEISYLWPHLQDTSTALVPAGRKARRVHVPTAQLDSTGSPRLELGYRFFEGSSEVLLSYRSLWTEGVDRLPQFDRFGDGMLVSHLDLDVVDLDYGNRCDALGPLYDVKWQAGARFGRVAYDSLAVGSALATESCSVFQGAGPHAAVELWRPLSPSPLALFVRLEGAVLVGRMSQRFARAFVASDGWSVVGGGETRVRATQAVPTTNLEAGLGWCPGGRRTRFAAGYQLENWWFPGRADLTLQGLFLRAEWHY